MPSCADRLLSLLEWHGVEFAFGVPGIHTVELYRTLANHRLRHVTPRHEQGAGFMAYGYAFATGRPAACFLITGPGMLNAATAIAEAYAESLPMIVIAASNRRAELGMRGGQLHEMADQHGVEKLIAGDAHLLLDPTNVDNVIERAFAGFAVSRPRPFCLQVPRDLLGETASEGLLSRTHWYPPGPAEAAVNEAAALLARAKRPLAIVGGGAWRAGDALRRLVERARIPVVSTTAGKGILPEAHALSAGAALPFASFQARLAEADVILAVGTELAGTDLLYTGASYRWGGEVIRIDIDPGQLMSNVKPAVAILSDAGLALEAIGAALAKAPAPNALANRAAWLESVTNRAAFDWSAEAPKHFAVLDGMASALDHDAIICSDSTQLAYTGGQYHRSLLPRTWLFPTGYGTLGSALPAAIGARLGAPDRQVVAIVGDGSFLYTVAELATAVELQLPLVILLWNNLGYGEIRDAMLADDVPPIGVDLKVPDFVNMARGFGCVAHHLRDLTTLSALIAEGFAGTVPTLIQIDAFDPMFGQAAREE